MSSYIRKPHVAGYFYPKDPIRLTEMIEKLLPSKAPIPKKAIAVISPHAGYVYSGYVAAETIANVLIPRDLIILGPNHTGLGAPLSIMAEGVWITPFGEIPINEELAQKILEKSRYLENDSLAHIGEHSIEVQLPIIQYFRRDVTLVPIVVGTKNLEKLNDLANAITNAVKEYGRDVLLISSTDFTHYEPNKVAYEKDSYVIEAILKLDPVEMLERVIKKEVSMCGVMPTFVVLSSAIQLGATKAELVRYMTSGDITGDTSQVVGYSGIIII
ncbi:MAG: AmmeMemoRadiSam system protein B [Thermosulfidibacteraceae bacterium]